MAVAMPVEQAVAQAVADAPDTLTAYRLALQAIVESLDWRLGAAWEADPHEEQALRCVVTWAQDDELAAFEWLTRSTAIMRGEGLPGRVWQTGDVVWVQDAAAEKWLPRRAAAEAAGLHAAVCFPVRNRHGIVGVIEVFGRQPLSPPPGLMDSLEVVGVQIGQLIERRRAEETSHAATQRHYAALQAAIDCIITMDHTGRIVEFNPAAERTFGWSSEQAVGREMAALIVPPELREDHRRGLQRYLERQQPRILDQRIEIEAVRADGSRLPVELTITRIDVPGPPMFTGHLRDISDRRLAEAELRASRTRVVQAGDAARRKFERDLHDGAQQQLVSLAMTLRTAQAKVQSDPQLASELLEEATSELGEAISELRELARGIHPAVLTEGGLDPALRGLVRRSSVPARLTVVPEDRLPADIEAAAYFVVAEGLTNVARHAPSASLVEIYVTLSDGRLVVEVRDDGGGDADESGGGLRGLADRLAALEGRLEVRSPHDVGTVLRAEVPCGS